MDLKLEFNIDELELDGFSPTDRNLISQAIERELERLFEERGAPPSLENNGNAALLDVGSFTVKSGSKAEEIGTQIAQTLYGGFSR